MSKSRFTAFYTNYRSLLSWKTFVINKLLSLIRKWPRAPLNRPSVCLPPPARSRWFAPHERCLYWGTAAFLSHRAADSSSSSHSLSLLLFFPHFLLSDIFAGEYFLLIFSCLPLYLFSTSSFDLGCACVLFIFWVKLTLIWSRFLMFYLLAEGERQVLSISFFILFNILWRSKCWKRFCFA